MAGGRPTNYEPDMVEKAQHYIENHLDYGDQVPMIVGLCRVLNRAKSTLYLWAEDENKPEFSDVFKQIEEAQHAKLVNGGLTGQFNSPIAKMMLTKHGYSDKVEQEHSSPDGSMSHPTTITFVTPGSNNGDQ